jgi:hypothetical protein
MLGWERGSKIFDYDVGEIEIGGDDCKTTKDEDDETDDESEDVCVWVLKGKEVSLKIIHLDK